MDIHEWPRCIKSARRKRRLVITDRDKQLIKLSKRWDQLEEQRRLQPKVPLEHPYQRGWKRFFVLRDDVKRSSKADFYEALLTKINTVEYHYDKSFKSRKLRKRRNVSCKEQRLCEFGEHCWQVNRMNLTEDEKACFTGVEFINTSRRPELKYMFTEPWRYVLKIAPHIITHVRLVDVDIERELSYIKGHVTSDHLDPRMSRLTSGRSCYMKNTFEPLKYINKLKNLPRYAGTEAYLDLDI
ncbi:hypothetical protein [Pedobacter faecalis]|uniref:hypothetical protein n=1 Tax=Pedobacter faecalis TaxID=3041495 RepID=UPI00254EA896|nr:hypothetical protein [Pedobacter sp. ELA7]